MITGYNTDVRHQDVVFHVQTEDKGSANPFIESLVYVGGQVLATKRASYANLLTEGKDETAIVALMDHQHRTMIAAIKQGKFDDKLGGLGASRQTGKHAVVAAAPAAAATAPAVAPPSPMAPVPRPPLPSASPAPPSLEETRLPPERPAEVRPPRGSERSLDQVILEYLTSEADQEQLVLMIEGEPALALGKGAVLSLRTSSSKNGAPVAGAHVSIKMISTIAEPRTLAGGRTDDSGSLHLLFEIPPLNRGTAALIISAVSPIGRAELKHLL